MNEVIKGYSRLDPTLFGRNSYIFDIDTVSEFAVSCSVMLELGVLLRFPQFVCRFVCKLKLKTRKLVYISM